jgi:xanthine dehydrogenase accessory factor
MPFNTAELVPEMDSLDTQVLDAARRWAAAGHRFALVTVARTWGSAPRPPGAWMILRDDGQVQGSVSGGCIEDDLIRRLLAGEFAATAPFMLRYGVTPTRRIASAALWRHAGTGHRAGAGLPPCSNNSPSGLRHRRTGASAGSAGDRPAGRSIGGSAPAMPAMGWPDFDHLHGPAWRLLIIGAGQISRYLATDGAGAGYRVYICDPRSEYADEWDVPGTERWSPACPTMP